MRLERVSGVKLILFVILYFVLLVLCVLYDDARGTGKAATAAPVPEASSETSSQYFELERIIPDITCIVSAFIAAVALGAGIPQLIDALRRSDDGHPNPPGPIVRETLGRLLHFADAKRREDFTKKQPLDLPRIDPDMPIAGLGYEPISAEQLRSENFVLITGPPGVGKSLHMAEQINQYICQFDLVLRLDPSKTDLDSKDHCAKTIWQSLFQSVITRLGCKRDAWLFAFMLAHRPVLIIVDDLHLTQKTTAEALSSIRQYFQKFHLWGQHVSVVCTTRETNAVLPDNLRRETTVVELRPMDQRPAQDLFWQLGTELGVPQDKLQAEGGLLGHAFNAPALRVPLFISICAYLIAPRHRRPLPIADVLKMTSGQLLEAFVTTLCERAFPGNDADVGEKERKVNELRTIVSELAYGLWPTWNNVETDGLNRRLRVMLAGRENQGNQYDVNFLVQSGFLVREFSISNKLGFPHQAVSDYLTAYHMVGASDFQKLELFHDPLRVESIRDILVDLVETAAVLERLFYSDPTAAAMVFDSSQYCQRGEPPDPEQVGEFMARWALGGAPYPLEDTVWEEVRRVFEERVCEEPDRRTWLRRMIREIRARADGTREEDIIQLSRVGYAETLAIIEGWLAEGGREHAFELAAGNRDVRKKLYEIVTTRGVRDGTGCAAFGVLWNRALQYGSVDRKREPIEEVVKYLDKVWKNSDESELRTLYDKFGKKILEWIGLLARNAPIDKKRTFSETCAAALGNVLVCAGTYQVEREGGSAKQIGISRPLWVPCVAEPPRKFPNSASARVALREYEQDLMSVDEATVVLRHFQHQRKRRGAMFEHPFEAFRSGIAGVEIYHIILQGHNPVTLERQTEVPITVRFRKVVRL